MSGEVAKNIQQAMLLKEQGNQHFKEGDYPKAIAAYHQIFMYVHGYSSSGGGGGMGGMPGQTTTPVSPEEMAQIRELKIAHFCNLAMCHMKHGPKFAKAKDGCTKALTLDPDNVKALFRRGKCHAQLGGLDEAKADFDRVLELQPDNRDAARELRALRGAFEKQRKKEQRKFAGMFDRLQQDDEMEAAAAAASSPGDASASSVQAADASSSHALNDASSLVEPAMTPKDAISSASGADIGERVGDPQAFEPQDFHADLPSGK